MLMQIAILKQLSFFCVTLKHNVVSGWSDSISTLLVVGALVAVDLKDPLTAF